jgi:hypothetical protein
MNQLLGASSHHSFLPQFFISRLMHKQEPKKSRPGESPIDRISRRSTRDAADRERPWTATGERHGRPMHGRAPCRLCLGIQIPEADTERSRLHRAWMIRAQYVGVGACWFRRHGCGRCSHARDRALGAGGIGRQHGHALLCLGSTYTSSP